MISRRKFIQTSGLLGACMGILPDTLISQSQESLPRVLLIGDSIAGGYFPLVQELMKGKAVLSMPVDEKGEPESTEGTTKGVMRIDQWLSGNQWDLVHFNFGLHDIKHINPVTGKNSKSDKDPHQASPKQYKKNLKEIVKQLKATGAKLIFATTTPYPDTVQKPVRKPGMPKKYNRVALQVMKQNGIAINDLHAFVLPQMEALQRPHNVHFTEAGSQALSEQVAKAIGRLL